MEGDPRVLKEKELALQDLIRGGLRLVQDALPMCSPQIAGPIAATVVAQAMDQQENGFLLPEILLRLGKKTT